MDGYRCAEFSKHRKNSKGKGLALDITGGNVATSAFVVMLTLFGLGTDIDNETSYNSVVNSSTSTNDYAVFSVNQVDTSSIANLNLKPKSKSDTVSVLHQAALSGQLERPDNRDCIDLYSENYISDRGDLLLVSRNVKDRNSSEPSVYFDGDIDHMAIQIIDNCVKDMYGWICPDADCNNPCQLQIGSLLDHPDNWRPRDGGGDVEVLYCLSQRTPEHCKLQFSVEIIILVIVMNFVKLVLMVLAITRLRQNPLITIGEAIASFLRTPDSTTRNMCLLSKATVDDWSAVVQSSRYELDNPPAKEWTQGKHRWADAVSKKRWWLCVIMILTAALLCVTFLAWGIIVIVGPKDISYLWGLGLGGVSVHTLIDWEAAGRPSTLVGNVLVANIPQLVLSFVYFMYNGAFTCMLEEREWTQFATVRKGLRVSRALEGSQRSTYFLQLPYRFAIPIIVFSGVLHWLVSQSIFLVAVESHRQGERIDYYNHYSQNTFPDKLTCGFSPIAIMFVVIIACCMIAVLLVLGMRRYDAVIPQVGSCSAVISAACHPEGLENDEHAASRPVHWGITRETMSRGDAGHCSFSSGQVRFVERYNLYI